MSWRHGCSGTNTSGIIDSKDLILQFFFANVSSLQLLIMSIAPVTIFDHDKQFRCFLRIVDNSWFYYRTSIICVDLSNHHKYKGTIKLQGY